MKIRIVGAGLIGTSMGLGLLKKGHVISFQDNSAENLRIAQDLVGESPKIEDPDLIVIATPIQSAFMALESEFQANPQATFIDIAGLKYDLIASVEGFPGLAERFCGTHPMAGREIAGPTGARADLFQGATWIITPTKSTHASIVDSVRNLVKELGGIPTEVGAAEHDRAISVVSHLPQVLSSLLASQINELDAAAISLAGQGLRDMTRLADGNANLWAQLLVANAGSISADLQSVQSKLSELIEALKSKEIEPVKNFLISGNVGKSKIPGKHGKPSREYAYLPIVIDDKPGQLAAIFDECAQASVNVEDLFIEHSPGQETGLITLALSKDDATVLRKHLVNQNWRVHDIRAQR